MPLSESQQAACLKILGKQAADFIQTLEPIGEARQWAGPPPSIFADKLDSAAGHAEGLRKAINESGEKGRVYFTIWLHESKIKLPCEPGAGWDMIEPILKRFEEFCGFRAFLQREGTHTLRRDLQAYKIAKDLMAKWYAFHGELPQQPGRTPWPTLGSPFGKLFAYFMEQFCPDYKIAYPSKLLRDAHNWATVGVVEGDPLRADLAEPQRRRPRRQRSRRVSRSKS